MQEQPLILKDCVCNPSADYFNTFIYFETKRYLCKIVINSLSTSMKPRDQMKYLPIYYLNIIYPIYKDSKTMKQFSQNVRLQLMFIGILSETHLIRKEKICKKQNHNHSN